MITRIVSLLLVLFSVNGLLAACQPTNQPPQTEPATDSAAVLICESQAGIPCSNATYTPIPTASSDPEETLSAYLVERTDAADALKAMQDGSAILLDVRSQAEFEKQHIDGAVVIPLAELEQRYSELDSQRWIITYCT